MAANAGGSGMEDVLLHTRDTDSDSSEQPEPIEWPPELRALPLMRVHEKPLVARSAMPYPVPALRKLDLPEHDLEPENVVPMCLEHESNATVENSKHLEFLEKVKSMVSASNGSAAAAGGGERERELHPWSSALAVGAAASGEGARSPRPRSPQAQHRTSGVDAPLPIPSAQAGETASASATPSMQCGVLVYMRPGSLPDIVPNRYVDLMQLTQGADAEEACPPLLDPFSHCGRRTWMEANLAFAGSEMLARAKPQSLVQLTVDEAALSGAK
mmetsp:Transcript_12582/g.30616  ORF Transcript_12582/g.30616 Transcript_12582/m.30616 type:complete len:272 (+) Transcript_12582:359-1174(+)|eukprot:CAMPEP_0178999912 /NCGR_PEP_ID=MMETSP0795-20121207/10362_1 /TAXON_ID=88552 /ORGANISM="Amoebophrya sp., Strain Ameob2" /LENGTH=271 /DNA_ID=CAMNT_0020692815 /DNA_START=308 /DNA_END=1123 /DNA_ORIENTATION=+